MKSKNYLIISLIGLALFLLTLFFVTSGITSGLDSWINQNFYSNGGLFTEFILVFNIFMNEYFLIAVSLVVFGLLIYFKKFKEAVFFIFVLVFAGIVGLNLKELIQHSRPENSLIIRGGFSFPSGHVLMLSVFLFLIFYLLRKEIKTIWINYLVFSAGIFFLGIVIVNRIYLRFHWFSDVFASVFLGIFLTCLSIFIFENYIAGLSK